MLLELALLAIAAVVAQVQAVPYSRSAADAIVGVAAVGMGLQNATARQLAVPDLTTSVVTMTLTGLATEVRARNRSTIVRRVLAVVTMLGGAVVGALLVLHVRPSASTRGRGWTGGRGHAGDRKRDPPKGRLAVRLSVRASGR